jgi:hypothetical protein
MTQADRVLSTPPTNTPICQSAPGAIQLSPPPVILTSPPDACQGVKAEPEPCRNSEIHSSGAVVSRRSVKNIIVSSAAITAAPSIAIAGTDDDRQLLDLEKRILEAHDAAIAYDVDIMRCANAWHDEL